MNTPPDGWTDIEVQAEHAPIGVQLWPTVKPDHAPSHTLRSAAVVRDRFRTWVVWTYENNQIRTFPVGEMVACRVREADADQISPFRARLDLNVDELVAVTAALWAGLGRADWVDLSPATTELVDDVLTRLRELA